MAKTSDSSNASQIAVSDSLPASSSVNGSPETIRVTAKDIPADNSRANGSQAQETPLTPGTFEVKTEETIAAVAPGEVVILSPVMDEVIATPALSVEARVAKTWTVSLEVNGESIPQTSIGTTRIDHKNGVATYGYVGINLRPGPNPVRVTATGPNQERGRAVELIVFGRGPAKRLEIVPERSELQASGRDSMRVRVRALDEWGHPAADAQIALVTSAGRLAPEAAGDTGTALALTGANVTAPNNGVSEQVNANAQQQVVSLVGARPPSL